jgi:hypothetical protein
VYLSKKFLSQKLHRRFVAVSSLVERIVEATGNADDRLW